MRTASVLAAGLLLAATLSGCADDPAPDRAAGPSGTPAPTTSRPAAPTSTPSTQTESVRLTGNGVDTPARLVEFGAAYDNARPVLDEALGPPTKDTGNGDSFSAYGTCPGDVLRALEYGGGALVLLFGDVDGPDLTFYRWALEDTGTPTAVPKASALIGDVTTYEFGVGTTVAQLREGAGEQALQVSVGEVPVPPTFRLTDQSSAFFGILTGTGPRDTAVFVEAGQSCGE